MLKMGVIRFIPMNRSSPMNRLGDILCSGLAQFAENISQSIHWAFYLEIEDEIDEKMR